MDSSSTQAVGRALKCGAFVLVHKVSVRVIDYLAPFCWSINKTCDMLIGEGFAMMLVQFLALSSVYLTAGFFLHLFFAGLVL